MNKIVKNYVSECCEAKMEVVGETTKFFVCSKCKKACAWLEIKEDNEWDKLDFDL